jgi:putative membrane protein
MELLAHYGHHGLFAIGSVITFGLFVLLVLGIAFGWRHRRPPQHVHHPGIGVLEERYARGEIDRDEFIARRKDLLES